MFKRKTVFIVGAGGSYELGLPVGDGLAKTIANKLNIVANSSHTQLLSGEPTIAAAAQYIAKSVGQDYRHWFRTAVDISKSMPLAISIDNFLHTHSRDETTVLLGKLAITASILEAERASDVFCEAHLAFDFLKLQRDYDSKRVGPSWHNVFFKMLTENVKNDGLDDVFQNVTFITFNYDRCIEHYLVHAFSQYMRLNIPDARALVAKLEIIHPYGTVGDLNSTPLGANPTTEHLVKISGGIRTFTEQVHESKMLELMQQRLIAAETIVSLGFSYGDMNLELMDIDSAVGEKTVIGTALGISEINRSKIELLLRQKLKLQDEPWLRMYLVNDTCANILRDHWRLIIN